MKAWEKDRRLYDDLIKQFPPPPYLIQREVRPWIYQEVQRELRKKPDSIGWRWYIIQMERLNWEKE